MADAHFCVDCFDLTVCVPLCLCLIRSEKPTRGGRTGTKKRRRNRYDATGDEDYDDESKVNGVDGRGGGGGVRRKRISSRLSARRGDSSGSSGSGNGISKDTIPLTVSEPRFGQQQHQVSRGQRARLRDCLKLLNRMQNDWEEASDGW